MTNNKRHSKRKPKLSNRFNDHVMSNLSKKHKDVNDVEEFDAIRVHMDDKVEVSREIREISKEKVMEEEESGEMGKKVNKGVFGSITTDAGNVGSSVDMEGEGKGGNPKSYPDFIFDCSIGNNPTPVCNETKNKSNTESNMKTYANKLTYGMNANDNELFYIPTVMKENGEKVVVLDEELVKEGSEK
ncbi:hypothetical protein Tco_1329698 [Tanacetum coccineum]